MSADSKPRRSRGMLGGAKEEHEGVIVSDSHKLAVLHHSTAIQRDIQLRRQKQVQVLDTPHLREWESALRSWYSVWTDEQFWGRLKQRIVELDDPRLKVTATDEIRAGLPMAILSINAKLATEYTRSGCLIRAAQHLELGQHSGFPASVVKEAYQCLFDPIKHNIMEMCEEATNELKKDETHAKLIYDNLHSRVLSELEKMAVVDPHNILSSDAIRDEVSNILRSAAVTLVNTANDYPNGCLMLQGALQIAVSMSTRKRIEEDLKTCRSLLTQGFTVKEDFDPSRCWFCGEQPADSKYAKIVKMHKILGRETVGWNMVRISYKDIDLRIPRCEYCNKQHGFHGKAAGLGLLTYLIAAVSITLAYRAWWFLAAAILAPPAWVVMWGCYRLLRSILVRRYCSCNKLKHARPEGQYKQCPLYEATTKDGFVEGKYKSQS